MAISEYDTRIPGYQDTRIPGYQDTRIPGYQDTRIPVRSIYNYTAVLLISNVYIV
jgi:hypothetical protein